MRIKDKDSICMKLEFIKMGIVQGGSNLELVKKLYEVQNLLYNSNTTTSELNVLKFLLCRLEEKYGENPRCDYMQSFKKFIDKQEVQS